jgi:hypothetical protein
MTRWAAGRRRWAWATVKQFVQSNFPDCITIVHGSVFWNEDIFTKPEDWWEKVIGKAMVEASELFEAIRRAIRGSRRRRPGRDEKPNFGAQIDKNILQYSPFANSVLI